MGAQRRTAARAINLLAAAGLLGALAISPAAVQGRTPSPTSQTTATRIATVNPLRDGVARSAGGGTAFGVPTAATRQTSGGVTHGG